LLGAFVEHLNRLAPHLLLRGIDLAQIQQVPLQHTSTGQAPILDDAPVPVHLAIFPPCGRA
jgi:hypothetical protein